MFKRKFFCRNYHWLILILCFLFPVNKRATVFVIALLVLNSILEGRYAERFRRYFNLKSFLLLSLPYLIYVLGMFNTTHLEVGWFDLEVKMGMLVFPLVFNMMDVQGFFRRYHRWYFTAFIFGLVLSEMICLIHSAILMSSGMPFSEAFFYINFSFQFHPSYLAAYLICGIAILVHFLLKERHLMSVWKKLSIVLLLLFFVAGVLLSNSKMGLITLVVLIMIALYFAVFIHKLYRLGLRLFIGCLLIVTLVLVVYPHVFYRFKTMIETVSSPNDGNKKNWDGSAERLYAWKYSAEAVRENWLMGVGTGDIKVHLLEKYNKNGMTSAYKSNLNCHNQYLQTALAIGVFGLASLLLMLFYPLLLAMKQKDFFYICFLLIFILGCIVESMFETQAGIVFFSFFNSLYFLMFYSVKRNIYARK